MDPKVLAQLDTTADPLVATPIIAAVVGAPVRLVIDLTDPPTPIRAEAGDQRAFGATADEAVTALGRVVATAVRAMPVAEPPILDVAAVAEVAP